MKICSSIVFTALPRFVFTSFPGATSKALRKATLLLFSIVVLLMGSTAAVRGQSALDGFDPNANGAVFTALAPNGGAAVTRNYMARLNADGTPDAAFDPNANDFVLSIAVQADGKILAGGYFNGTNSIGGQTRNRIARLDPTTGLADSFDPNASYLVYSIAVQADGKVLAGGFFGSIGGQTRNGIARLDPTTGAADSFDPNASGAVYSIAVQADGKVLAGGTFSRLGRQRGKQVARHGTTTREADCRAAK